MMLQIGGGAIADVFDLAEHAEQIKVDCILSLPDLYFKAKTEEDLVSYFKEVVQHCPTRPFYYYHIPRMSGVDCKYRINHYMCVKLNRYIIFLIELSSCSLPNSEYAEILRSDGTSSFNISWIEVYKW